MAYEYPFKNYNFTVEIGGTQVFGCSEVSGMDLTLDTIEYREGDYAANTPRKQPGLAKYSNITLKRGVVIDKDFFTWVTTVNLGTLERKNITIKLLDDAKEAKAAWQVTLAWPAKYTGPDFNGTGSEVAMESIEFAHEGLTRIDV